MPHDTPLISTIVAGLVLAFILGAIANRLRMPPLVGYLAAGVLVGPFTPGFVADIELATELSEIGVILLMFGVGLHFSLKDLLSVRALAIPGAIVQIVTATLLGLGLATLMGWSLGGGLIFGLSLSVASTVVLLKALQDRHMVESERGRIAVGWLIVEDLAMVLALVLIPALASLSGSADAIEAAHADPFVNLVERLSGLTLGVPGIVVVTLIKLAAFVGFMLVVGRRVIPLLLHYTAHTGSRELFRLAVLAIALGVAAGAAYLFGVSLALGAFFAGMILSESELSHRAAEESLPLRDAFAVLFFVAVGMLFDPMIILTDPLPLLGTIFIIVVGKSVFAFLIVVAFKRPVGTALTISASLAQIGEFSFILAAMGVALGLLPPEGRDLVLAGAILSIVLNPAIFAVLDLLRPSLEKRFGSGAAAETKIEAEPVFAAPATPTELGEDAHEPQATLLTDHIVLVGYGRVGTVVAEALMAAKRAFVVIEDAEAREAAARHAGVEVIGGNAVTPRLLALANVAGAKTVIVAIPNTFEAGQVVEQCRKLNEAALIVARAHSDEEEEYLKTLGANIVILGEREIGLGLFDVVSRDSQAIAEITAADAVEAVLAPMAKPTPRAAPSVKVERVEPVLVSEPAVPALSDEAPLVVEASEVVPPVLVEPPEEPEAETEPEAEPELEAEPEPAEPAAAAEDDAKPDPDALAAAVTAAQAEVQEPDSGPAEPLAVVPTLGQEPGPERPAREAPAAASAAPAAEAKPEGGARPAGPARRPGVPFSHDVRRP